MKKIVFLLGSALFISMAVLMMGKTHSAPTPEVSEVGENTIITSAAMATTPAANVELNSESKNGRLSPELSKDIEAAKMAMPSIQEVRKSGVDLHETPPQIIRGGAALGDLAEYLKKNPAQFSQASGFYADCAASKTLLPAMRVICYHELSLHEKEWAPGVKDKLGEVSPEVIGISKRL